MMTESVFEQVKVFAPESKSKKAFNNLKAFLWINNNYFIDALDKLIIQCTQFYPSCNFFNFKVR